MLSIDYITPMEHFKYLQVLFVIQNGKGINIFKIKECAILLPAL